MKRQPPSIAVLTGGIQLRHPFAVIVSGHPRGLGLASVNIMLLSPVNRSQVEYYDFDIHPYKITNALLLLLLLVVVDILIEVVHSLLSHTRDFSCDPLTGRS